jgi:DNA-binding CsgD family transcriptional regulator
MVSGLRGAERELREIEALADSGLDAQQLLEEAGRRIDRVVPSDGYFLAATDPETMLCIGAGVVEELPLDQCQPTWDYEFLVPDYLKFADIAASGRMVGDLHERTGGRPERSPRWREYGGATGFRSEVRMTFMLGDGTWGVGQLDRLGDTKRFSETEQAWLERVAPVIARGLRRTMVHHEAGTHASRGPGIVLLDAAGALTSANAEAAAWLDEVEEAAPWGDRARSVPTVMHAYAARVRAASPADPAPPARLRTRSGIWLRMHGSLLEGTDQLALVIEPAKASDVAPLIVEAYGITQRELDVIRMIARGLGTSEIAAQLFLSPHTVRDHVKSVFEKVGVSSRGELVAKVFADHYAPIPH